MSKWLYLFIFFIFFGLLYPIIYVLNIQNLYGGIFLSIPAYIMYLILIGFSIYPFYKSIDSYNKGFKKTCIIWIVAGVFTPIISGVFGIFFFEFLGNLKYKKS